MTKAGQTPRAESAPRLDSRSRHAGRCDRMDRNISVARLVVASVAVVIGWLVFSAHSLDTRWILLPVVIFAGLVVVHERVIRARRKVERAVAYYRSCLARLEGRWAGQGKAGWRFLDDDHPFAGDLDLFGIGSVFELLCTARTRAGEETLADWLRSPAAPAEVRERHAAVRELRDRIDLREDLAALAAQVRSGVDPDALASWAGAPRMLSSRAVRVAALLLPAASIAALGLWAAGLTGRVLPIIVLMGQVGFALSLRGRVDRVLGAVDRSAHDLDLLSQVLARIERERFESPRLASLRAALDTAGSVPSACIARLHRLVERLDYRRNQMFAPLAFLLMWGTQIAHAIEAWRARSGGAVAGWLAAVGQFEAFCSLACYAYENPEDPFPDIEEGPARFETMGLGHPLIERHRCVENDVALGADRRVLMVSGSNMSGKSTLLRSVGVNVVLAQAGAPVRARKLRMSALALGASIRIQDSLQAGTSHFYAEITRLRQIVDLAGGPTPVLFLIDEMLHGTNSHDRRIGAEAVVRGLIERGSIGLVTTHDLALAQLSVALGDQVANVHFQDHLERGKMTFDYLLRTGVVEKSNALELMRAVGLEV